MRADAQRNRRRLLDTATRVFAAEGLGVPVHEIARRAGVGTGTVSRHFPTKQALYDAVVLHNYDRIMDRIRGLLEWTDADAAFAEFFEILVEETAANRGMFDALRGAGYDLDAAAVRAGYDFVGVERELLERAQQAGAVRTDLDLADIKALLIACLDRDTDAHRRMIEIVLAGLRPP